MSQIAARRRRIYLVMKKQQGEKKVAGKEGETAKLDAEIIDILKSRAFVIPLPPLDEVVASSTWH